MQKQFKIIFLTCCVLWLSSCYYDNQDDLYPSLGENCTTQQGISFSTTVLPLMNLHCNTSGCHNGNDRAGNIVLDNHNELLVSANNSSLVGSMKQDGTYSPMPLGAAKLDICDIQIIEDWITQGALDN